jgi:hypothetical protein
LLLGLFSGGALRENKLGIFDPKLQMPKRYFLPEKSCCLALAPQSAQKYSAMHCIHTRYYGYQHTISDQYGRQGLRDEEQHSQPHSKFVKRHVSAAVQQVPEAFRTGRRVCQEEGYPQRAEILSRPLRQAAEYHLKSHT